MKSNKTLGVVTLALSLCGAGAAAAAEDSEPSAADVQQSAETAKAEEGQSKSFLEKLPINLDGYAWVDTGYMERPTEQAGLYEQHANYMQGRFVLGAEYQHELGSALFGRARVEFIGFVNEFSKSQYEPHTLDGFVQVGHKKLWDVQVGRFLAWEVYRRGQGIELFTAEEAGAAGAPALYWMADTRGYRNESGQVAVHYYPTRYLSFELASVYGQEANQNNLGVRPVADLKLGRLHAVAGLEYLQQRPQTVADKVESTTLGFAARVEYAFPVLTLGANYAQGNTDVIDIQGLVDTNASALRRSVGGTADIYVGKSSIGLGFHRTQQTNEQTEVNTHDQAFVSFLYPLPIKGLSAKAVAGYASANLQDIDTRTAWTNGMRSVRLRIAYEFN